ncbi:2-dehydro-3-deoxy-6-phosphogalactonate aldolase [Parvibaculaceae bacterium PLY_AMNH_Bact1]|nr:2-dehydro-3-deoxy-6-phosphogalactonate aldolase [Parvibaculaceae bacterium PLY_AMNH_Bact1]
MSRLRASLERMPIVAILRGLQPAHAVSTAQVLVEAGICILEVPLNVDGALRSIEAIRGAVGDDVLVGGGTLRTVEDLAALANAGGELAVMPHLDASLVIGALDVDLIPVPGVFTPSEGFAALDAGAEGLKIFPAEALSPKAISAWRSVMSREEAALLPTGGISAENVGEWWSAGADGFGVGSAVFDPGGDLDETRRRANSFVSAITHARA